MPSAKVVASFAVPHIELVADDGKEHGMCTEQQLPILNGVKTQIWGNLGRSTPVPACAVAVFRLEHRIEAACYWSLDRLNPLRVRHVFPPGQDDRPAERGKRNRVNPARHHPDMLVGME